MPPPPPLPPTFATPLPVLPPLPSPYKFQSLFDVNHWLFDQPPPEAGPLSAPFFSAVNFFDQFRQFIGMIQTILEQNLHICDGWQVQTVEMAGAPGRVLDTRHETLGGPQSLTEFMAAGVPPDMRQYALTVRCTAMAAPSHRGADTPVATAQAWCAQHLPEHYRRAPLFYQALFQTVRLTNMEISLGITLTRLLTEGVALVQSAELLVLMYVPTATLAIHVPATPVDRVMRVDSTSAREHHVTRLRFQPEHFDQLGAQFFLIEPDFPAEYWVNDWVLDCSGGQYGHEAVILLPLPAYLVYMQQLPVVFQYILPLAPWIPVRDPTPRPLLAVELVDSPPVAFTSVPAQSDYSTSVGMIMGDAPAELARQARIRREIGRPGSVYQEFVQTQTEQMIVMMGDVLYNEVMRLYRQQGGALPGPTGELARKVCTLEEIRTMAHLHESSQRAEQLLTGPAQKFNSRSMEFITADQRRYGLYLGPSTNLAALPHGESTQQADMRRTLRQKIQAQNRQRRGAAKN